MSNTYESQTVHGNGFESVIENIDPFLNTHKLPEQRYLNSLPGPTTYFVWHLGSTFYYEIPF